MGTGHTGHTGHTGPLRILPVCSTPIFLSIICTHSQSVISTSDSKHCPVVLTLSHERTKKELHCSSLTSAQFSEINSRTWSELLSSPRLCNGQTRQQPDNPWLPNLCSSLTTHAHPSLEAGGRTCISTMILPRNLYSSPPPPKDKVQDNPTLLVSWWCTGFAVAIILVRLAGRYVRTERLFKEDKIMALSLIPLLLRMGLVHLVLLWGTNNTTTAGLTSLDISHREIGSRLVLASRIMYAML